MTTFSSAGSLYDLGTYGGTALKHRREPGLTRRRFVQQLGAAVTAGAALWAVQTPAEVSAAPGSTDSSAAGASFGLGDHRISADTVFDDVRFARGARLVVDDGCTVRIQGQIDAPPDVELFAGARRVIYETHRVVYANWWVGDDIGGRWNRIWRSAADTNVPNARVLKIYGHHLLRKPINATGERLVPGERPPISLPTSIDLTEARLIGQPDGRPMIDLTGARYTTIIGGLLSGSSTSLPNIGLLLAPISAGGSANNIETHGVTIQGYFTVAAVYNYASEL